MKMTWTKDRWGSYNAYAPNGDKFQISGSRDEWMLRTWNAGYGAWLGDRGPVFPRLKDAKAAAEEAAEDSAPYGAMLENLPS